ncbi:patatin-like phospholipase family protein [Pseudonocardia oroxyli]|uniref:Predicted phospholipase, patatin/cPLA2 family n=1 Tax=Pseudonocardia oroxyli TaxID=366584 RepID=A0A1G7GBD8_PSEOR|nr:patatin-like phospholipase family protein [Pseudonocardia oroxyli]SDE85339.1 Predicted phospholipase, patatin/cPLA2 family [Pseudonocardia oroxyli]
MTAPDPWGDAWGDQEVLRALLRRREAGSRPGERRDGHRIALVVGGGGMRGAYAGGMVWALEQAGLTAGFDLAYGASAGAFVATAALLGHGYDASRIFPDDMARPEFVDPRRLGRAPMVSLDHLIHEILVHTKPTDWEALRDHPAPLHVVVTDAADMTPHTLTGLRDAAEWRLAMRATAAIPYLTGPPVEVRGRRWVDGSIGDPLPVGRALREGATHVLALLTRTLPELRRPAPANPWWARGIDRLVPGLGAMTQDVARHADSIALLADAAHPARGGRHVCALSPLTSADIRGLTVDPVRVERASHLGHAAAAAAIRAVDPGFRLGPDEFPAGRRSPLP